VFKNDFVINLVRLSDCPRGLRRRSATARLPRLWVRFPPGCLDVCRECRVLSLVQRSATDCGA
jgi:hypothetical protein